MKLSSIKVAIGTIMMATFATSASHAINIGGLSRNAAPKIERYATPSTAPMAYMMFCLKERKQCRASSRANVAYSKGLMSKLERVNRKVNRQIKPLRDRGDVWTVGVRRGDCEDFALTKRRDLIRAGIPSGALRMAVVKTRGGIGHAVLVVKTDRGDLVLDNRRKRIVAAHKSGYRFLKMATNNPIKWEKIHQSKYFKASKVLSRQI